VFEKKNGVVYMGGVLIDEDLLDTIEQQARDWKTSQLYEIIQSTCINEAIDCALIQSTDFEAVVAAKMLYHWSLKFKDIIDILAK
jgi:hypothetical protein